MTKRADIRIGVSGWTYPPWRGNFYPEGLPQKRELAYATRAFNAIEVNGTFYGMQKPENFRAWADEAPADTLFALKGSRYLTHMLRLREPQAPLANFFASGPLALGEKLGPVLWQFPPNLRFNADRIEAFFALLPKDTEAAAELGRRHDKRLRARAFLRPGKRRPVRHAMEIRHDSFRDPAFIDLLRRYGVALVIADTVDWPCLMDLTADFVYCRLHGSEELYNSAYSDDQLERWAKRIEAWSGGRAMTDGNFVTAPARDRRRREVFLFFDNTDKLHAPEDARRLMRRLGIKREESEDGGND
jgi:uncharacterized protein YecE (DUF72 family)